MISELTEMTEPAEGTSFRGWIFYDADCGSCRDLALRWGNFFARRGFYFEPLQHEWVRQRLNLTKEEALEEMRVLTSGGEVFGGADAVILLARQIRWAAPLSFLARSPSLHAILHRLYRWVAAHRACAIDLPGGTCFRTSDFAGSALPGRVGRAEARPSEDRPRSSLGVRTRWLGLGILPLIALSTKPFLPAWGFMWLMAFALFFGCKWLTLGTVVQRGNRVCPVRTLAYLFA